MLSSFFFFFSLYIKSTVCGGGMTMRREERGRRKRWEEEREMMNFLVIYEFAEELQYSANLLSTVAPHHFVEEFVESAGGHF
jgi:hypothetical protein